MKLLEKKILEEAVVLEESILKVDHFINQQLDIEILRYIGQQFAHHFSNNEITRILTVEASGIAFAIATALNMGDIPVVFAKKGISKLNSDDYVTEVYSFTRKQSTNIWVNKKYITAQDRVLIIDDFLANGSALSGLIDIVLEAQAQISGIGIVIEKIFQGGRAVIEERGYKVFSLARIASLTDNKIVLAE